MNFLHPTSIHILADLETNPIYGNDPSAKLVSSKTFLVYLLNLKFVFLKNISS
jgi:hypothetical protein